ncbi:TPA: Flp pilus assembly complex ATPase component TadA [Candidatus Avigastranaerophilus faecigallinarum]|nr:Flp pilus assembly complex ATPase component TadA [Candidatus Avigastranaerophilus faecigallinarum]
MELVTNKTLEKLKYDLVRDGLVNYEDLEKAQEIAASQNVNIGQILIKSNLISEDTLLKFLESKLHIPYVDLKDYSLDKRCLSYVSFNDAQKYKIIPLFKIENVLTVAMADPLDLFAIDKIVEKTGCDIEPVVSAETLVLKKIEEYYKTDSTVGQINIESSENKFDWQEELHNDVLSDEHIQILIRAILKQAILNNVHEMFFEHIPNGLTVNFRQGSEIVETGQIPSVLVVPFISKLKALSSLDANVCELPQLGKLIFKVEDIILTASISAFPTINGERISLKIYKPPKPLCEIGLSDIQINTVKRIMETPGIVLVCGSSLAGKTHIIYSVLSEYSHSDKNIMTIESIAKYNLENINQCELNENIGFNIDKAMRFIEFQSPDLIYFEGITSKAALDYFSSLVFKDKVLITEFLADNMADLNKKLSYSDFEMFKPLISCIIFVHNQDRIEVLDRDDLNKFIK